MKFPEYFEMMIWMNIRVCLPFTIIIIFCCVVRSDQFTVVYYINLLVCNLMKFVILISAMTNVEYLYFSLYNYFSYQAVIYFHMYCCVEMLSLCFRMIMALERCFYISRPQMVFIRKTKGFVMICVSVWVVCMVLFPFFMVFQQYVSLITFVLLFALVSVIIGITTTLISLPAASSVPAEIKCKTVGILVLLLVNVTVTSIPTVILLILSYDQFIYLTLVLLSPIMDLILFVFMCKKLTDRLLTFLSCCKMENAAENDRNRLSV